MEKKLRTRNPDFKQRATEIWNSAPFIRTLGFDLNQVDVGRCESSVTLQEIHKQQNGFVHAGVAATLADHTAGASAGSLVAADEVVLSIEFKINLLRPMVGDSLRCSARVIKNGKTVIVCESEVFIIKRGREKIAAKAMLTMAVVGSSFEGSSRTTG